MGKGIVNNPHKCYYLCYNKGTNIYETGKLDIGEYLANGLDILECFESVNELTKRCIELGFKIKSI